MLQTQANTIPKSPQELKTAFGRRLAELRKERSLTQEKLAQQIKKDVVFVAYIEGGKRSPSFSTLTKLAQVLDVPPAELFRF